MFSNAFSIFLARSSSESVNAWVCLFTSVTSIIFGNSTLLFIAATVLTGSNNLVAALGVSPFLESLAWDPWLSWLRNFSSL